MKAEPLKARPKGDPLRKCETRDCVNDAMYQIRIEVKGENRIQHLCDEHLAEAEQFWKREVEESVQHL